MKTIEEKIAVMQAFKDGKQVEFYHTAKKKAGLKQVILHGIGLLLIIA